jgi:hypothetical protein
MGALSGRRFSNTSPDEASSAAALVRAAIIFNRFDPERVGGDRSAVGRCRQAA